MRDFMRTPYWEPVWQKAQANPQQALANPLNLTEAEWRTRLSPEQYAVLRERGTERPFSAPLCGAVEAGRYTCAGCGTPLFEAQEKFESGTGWPSFTAPVAQEAVSYYLDETGSRNRVEVCCTCCGGHLGHVFPDGPFPSGLRYCINRVALEKV
jgi:peptide-methionine (R)-S-oxide reductase